MKHTIQSMMSLLDKSYSTYHAVDTMKETLIENGYIQLDESEAWNLKKDGKYFVIRGLSSIIAFQMSDVAEKYGFNIVASHSDSPGFKLKPITEINAAQSYVTLNIEPYGGMIMSTWFDRPLTIAGKVVVKEDGKLKEKLMMIDEDLLVIPSLAIHQNREANEGYKINPQTMMSPLFADGKLEEGMVLSLIAKQLNMDKSDIYLYDLFLTPRIKATLTGLNKEFILSPRLDDLECAYSSLFAFMQSNNENSINVFSCFDHEEIGSNSRMGAASTFLMDILKRVNDALGYQESHYLQALAKSMIVSADNAHAVHPNFPEKADPTNKVFLNKGIVIKHHAGQSYTTDALSASVMKYCFEQSNQPYQHFTNRSDTRGGGTLGSISASQVSILSVDIGFAQLAMHSIVELAGVKDFDAMIEVLKTFYTLNLKELV